MLFLVVQVLVKLVVTLSKMLHTKLKQTEIPYLLQK